MFIEIDKIQKTIIDLSRIIPDIHGKDQSKFEHQEEQPLDDLDRIGHEKTGFHRHKDRDDRADDPERIVLDITQVFIHQERGHQHSDRDREPVCRRHRLRSPEIQHDQETTRTKDPVDARNIDLAADSCREFYRDLRPEIQADRFIDQRETTADQRLAGNDRSGHRNKDARDQEPVRYDRKEGIRPAEILPVLQEYPGPLAQIIYHQRRLYKDPAHL